MAKRKQLFHPDEVKKKIQTSQLINRLQKNALSDDETMTPGQIASANSLLDRVVPKLKAIEHSGEVETTIVRRTIYEAKPGSE
ncbi:MAG: hypothetical protein ACPG4X_16800 [Pikeienuella sp.]